MKIIRLLFVLTLISLVPFELHSQNILKDDFIYNPTDSLEGLGGWYRSGVNTAYNIKVTSPGLTYTGYAGSGRGNTVSFSNSGQGDIVFRNINQISTGSVYMAFMVRVDSLGTTATQGYMTGFNPAVGTSLSSSLQVRKVTSNTFNFGIRKRMFSTYTAATYTTGTTYLAVIRYIFKGGSNSDDSVKLYIFNSGVPGTEPASPTVSNADSLDADNIGSVYITNNYAQGTLNGCKFSVDGIRVGTTWATSVLSSVTRISSEIPESYTLRQNYPNPFNPVTVINYSLRQGGPVALTIHDALGRQVDMLVNEFQNAGTYRAEWDAAAFPSGVYYYRIQTKGYNQTKSMVLIK